MTPEQREVLRIAAARNFVAFCYYYDWDFFKKRPFLKRIALAFQRIADGEIKSLGVSMPPRAGKSYITTLFSAWMLGRFPEGSVMRNTCTAMLYNKFSYETRDVVKSEKFAEVFPGVQMSGDKANVQGWNTNRARMVSYFGAGVGGTIIGFGATLVAITDDLFKSMEDAMSETIREKTHSWKEATHDSRKESGCPEIDIGTRWTRDDVIGKAVDEGLYDEYIVQPALEEVPDENTGKLELRSFCENVMTTDEYLKKRERVRPEIWSAEYMQEPVDIKGRLFNNLRRFTNREEVLKNSSGALAYIDVADGGGDYLCLLVGHVVGRDVYITDVVFTKRDTDYTIPLCARLLNSQKVKYCRVETNGQGGVFLKQLRKLTEKTKILGITNSTHKQTRIFLHSSYVLRKFLFLDVETGEYGQYITQLQKYQHDGKNLNDDAPDATTGLAQMFDSFMPKLDS